MNQVFLLGRLGRDPELSTTPSGVSYAKLRLATSAVRGSGDDRVEHTEWHDIKVWNQQAETCHRYLRKGRQILVEGSLTTHSWEPNPGERKYRTEVRAHRITFVPASSNAAVGAPQAAPSLLPA